ncbi:Mob1 family protein [Nannizzia gypsea CBS 118893]|uniref:Mob1 family protein n=1 Tax=Arthroderma gypseum (strain ATCC MYA-4604 / CBS 118893) TaxID=535722 RepID=E4V3H4_ARTGP|nr:Mob1 family protein [Nannizzia gypsea CBS 118893]EFR04548.1 Mob1 family protein [Nannizzia gypsea CBS 118893]
MSGSAVSPSSSPRLPSPPPFTEVQIGPKSPTVGDGKNDGSDEFLGIPHGQDDASARRIRPGTKAANMASGPPLVPLSELDSPFQLQEHLKASYHHFTQPSGSDTVAPITREIARDLAEPPAGVERSLWLYELCRFLTMKANNLVIAFFAEEPPCSAQTCPEMRASEWQYLCAVHDPPKSCCAIDYCCHTLDWATNVLTSPKFFPSRLTLGSDATGGPQASMRHLTNVFRRVYRIFAHAWFQHRGVFWQVEGHDGLYVFFKTVCDVYNLIPDDNYTIPPEAEGEASSTDSSTSQNQGVNRRLTILRKEDSVTATPPNSLEEPSTGLSAATTRRHRHSPSTGVGVTTIAEAAEDDDLNKNIQRVPQPPKDSKVEKNEKIVEDISEELTEEPESLPTSEERDTLPEAPATEASESNKMEQPAMVSDEPSSASPITEEVVADSEKESAEEAPGSPGPSEPTISSMDDELEESQSTIPVQPIEEKGEGAGETQVPRSNESKIDEEQPSTKAEAPTDSDTINKDKTESAKEANEVEGAEDKEAQEPESKAPQS